MINRGGLFQDSCTIEHDSHGGDSVMVWAGVSLHNKTNIIFIMGNLAVAHYQHVELDTEVIPLLETTEECSCCMMVLQPNWQGPPLHI